MNQIIKQHIPFVLIPKNMNVSFNTVMFLILTIQNKNYHETVGGNCEWSMWLLKIYRYYGTIYSLT